MNQVRGSAVHICSGSVRKTVDFVRGCSGGLRELFGFVRVVFDSASGVVREGFGIASGSLRLRFGIASSSLRDRFGWDPNKGRSEYEACTKRSQSKGEDRESSIVNRE